MVRFNSSLSNEYVRLCKLYEWRSSLRCSMPTHTHYCLFFCIHKHVGVLDKFLSINLFPIYSYRPMNAQCLAYIFHLTILLSMSDHIAIMPFIYKVMHITNEQSSSHYKI